MEQGWGKPQIDRSISETPLSLGGKKFAHGVGTHAKSVVWIDLAGGSDRFLATVGVDEAAKGMNYVTFKIAGDGKTLFDSGVMNKSQPPKTVDIDVKGLKTLVLTVGLVGGGIDFAHGDWADARFLVSGAKPRTIDAPFEKGIILTPPPPATPRINGAKIFGVRPGSPFFFTIPATGQRPMTFAVENLPPGLSVNPQTGYITGTLDKRGEYAMVFQASNALGTARRSFKLVCGDTLNLTPEMGWNSWYYWTNRVTDKVMRDGADAMVSTGLINHGYIYVNIDDCWANGADAKNARDAAGRVNANHNFPDMKAMTDYIHHRGLRAGLYTSPGPSTCAGCTGAYRHEEQDVQRFVAWGFDFLKYDWCSCGATETRAGRATGPLPQDRGHPQEAAPRHRAQSLPVWHGRRVEMGQGSGKQFGAPPTTSAAAIPPASTTSCATKSSTITPKTSSTSTAAPAAGTTPTTCSLATSARDAPRFPPTHTIPNSRSGRWWPPR